MLRQIRTSTCERKRKERAGKEKVKVHIFQDFRLFKSWTKRGKHPVVIGVRRRCTSSTNTDNLVTNTTQTPHKHNIDTTNRICTGHISLRVDILYICKLGGHDCYCGQHKRSTKQSTMIRDIAYVRAQQPTASATIQVR